MKACMLVEYILNFTRNMVMSFLQIVQKYY